MSILLDILKNRQKNNQRVAAILKTAIFSIKILQIDKITSEMISECSKICDLIYYMSILLDILKNRKIT